VSEPHDDFDFDNEYDADEDDGEYEDCGLMPNGQCSKAGSEECDWICGALDREDFDDEAEDPRP
jgi:hypothetical protein